MLSSTSELISISFMSYATVSKGLKCSFTGDVAERDIVVVLQTKFDFQSKWRIILRRRQFKEVCNNWENISDSSE